MRQKQSATSRRDESTIPCKAEEGVYWDRSKGKWGKAPHFFSQLGQQWDEVSYGGMERKKGGLKQAGWPGPLLADGGKRHLGLSHWMLSSTAIVWQAQRQTHALVVSLATTNRNKLHPPGPTCPPLLATHTYYTPHHPASEPHLISGLHNHPNHPTSSRVGIPIHRARPDRESHASCSPDLWGLRRVRSQTSGDTDTVCFHTNMQIRCCVV